MGIQDLHAFLENEGVSVDLFRIARTQATGLSLVLDAEGCLDRLYGGYFSDWACGGQWARCVQFLTTLATALAEHQVALCVCFNGAHPAPPAQPQSWIQTQAMYRQRVNSVLRHIFTKGTPPPKVWWVPPSGLHSCLRTALRYLNIPVMVSSDDHYQEVVGLCREKSYAALVGCAGEYLAFQPPRYFNSSQLKLTYRSSLETKEFFVHDLPKVLDVPQERLSLVAALLGGNILSENSLSDFYKRIGITQKKAASDVLVKAVCQFVRNLPSSDVDAACVQIFGDMNDLRAAKLKQAVQYYINGTKDGFLKYRTASGRRAKSNKKNQQGRAETSQDLDTSKLATESTENERKGLENYNLATANASISADSDPANNNSSGLVKGMAALDISSGQSQIKRNKYQQKEVSQPEPSTSSNELCPSAPAEVLRTCAERHARGLMHPQMLSVLTHRQVTLPVLMEDEHHREIPSIHHFFRPIRQNVYAILFNMHHHRFMAQKAREEGSQGVDVAPALVGEWIYSRPNPGKSVEPVRGVMLDWPVPTVQRLWFGTAQDDKCRRMRAFLSCMRSDTPLMLNTSYVPQHLLILASVLRYIMTSPIQILRRQELDAFLATAFSNDLMNALHLQEMTVTGLNSRGVQLAALFMAGVDAALLANDACGAPVPWLVAAPWLYFDGKLLQRNLVRALHCKHLAQLCDKQLDVLVKVERMRKAIVEGVEAEFALAPLGVIGGGGGGWRRRGGRLEVGGVVVGQWGGGTYRPKPRHLQANRHTNTHARSNRNKQEAGQSTRAKNSKNGRKTSNKGKKRSPKAETSTAAAAAEANGPQEKKSTETVEPEHIGQGDAPVS